MKITSKIISLAILIWTSMTIWAQYKGKGIASFYSDKLHGQRMSNGDRYHRDSMTCAHLKYPLGTLLKVRNPLNNKEVVVKVTDRGPHSKKFIIDLSKAAAKEIGVYGTGFTTVEITPYRPGECPYKNEDTIEVIPELDLDYEPIATYPEPGWKDKKE